MPNQEQKFLTALKDIFIGAKIEGQSGYVNLMHIKGKYFEGIFPILIQDINVKLSGFPDFREEMFEKLYFFFSRYFNQTGSIYFNYTPLYQNIYDKVYDPNRDVILFWKTHMLYYVKSEAIYKSMKIEIDGLNFFFDASQIENKKNNERRNLIFEFNKVGGIDKKVALIFNVNYSKNGRVTKIDEILKALKKEDFKNVTEEILEQSFSIFKKQSEVDFFINKNAKEFLKEQFDLFLYQYMFKEVNQFDEKRIKELQSLKEIAYNIISFISQFEDELVKIWNKPKFPLNSNYVITLDRLPKELVEKLIKHPGIKEQIAEWKELGLVKDIFKPKDIIAVQTSLDGKEFLKKECRFLPVDTKYFKDLELEILSLFDNLDDSLDGTLIHSENYQALNTLKRKYRGAVKTIYIDPPFNLDSSDQFLYRTNYKDANWATLLENRISIAKDFLSEDGSIFVRCDYNGNYIVRFLLDTILGKENFRNEIVLRRAEETKGDLNKQFRDMKSMTVNYDNIYWYSNNFFTRFTKIIKPTTDNQKAAHWHSFWKSFDRKNMRYEIQGVSLEKGQWMWERNRASTAIENYKEYLKVSKTTNETLEEYWLRDGANREFIKKEGDGISSIKYWIPPREFVLADTNWLDIKGYSNTTDFKTENSELLLKRIFSNINQEGNLVFDFFMGSSTTQAVAQKLGRKWLGVEMGEHFFTVVLPRMKKVIAGVQSGISKETDYKGGGFFKYYSLEQYEDTLQKVSYKEDALLIFNENKTPYEQYIFMRDDKLTDKAVKINAKDKTVQVTLNKLYPNIDAAETLSLITGKKIKKITEEEVEFNDGSKESLTNPNYHLFKEFIWWQ
ncbi:MAG: site-specific DNA-methyltransferase [Ignavibacteria bacterium CG_4_8_14_3_um_filter_37_9]|nr:site-specific DNA-methyltransferase [Ignavibacteria bacterium]PIS44618.1 MAG: site-specific DNA-methyltransferase [Ignavibacteria bacterium CG08_land_8_20_14_0_20_37_9]PIW99715.1 MAG: site-specific DNA-methyltransferase [Ignavibacteria bacterium CG_4_8_14_3_um_filter_37_9]PIX95047.1 MAG: site-specific DNA-methyltransferase [Ignavibacteria bacterium CG_4_10_14_3_um_filter_37_18]